MATHQWRVLASATVRAGPDKDSPKIGELAKGTVIDVTGVPRRNSAGLSVVQTTTAPHGRTAAGPMYVKMTTSKGKTLLEKLPVRSLGGSLQRARPSTSSIDEETTWLPQTVAPQNHPMRWIFLTSETYIFQSLRL